MTIHNLAAGDQRCYNFILFLLYLLVLWTSINLVDFYLVRHGHYDVPSFFRQDGGEYGRFQWQTVAIYLDRLRG
jgi:nucleobase:cation symporter-1, NCS1 family